MNQTATIWLAYMWLGAIDPSWSLWFDTHWNHEAFFVLRAGVQWQAEDGPSVAGGYAQLWLSPGDGTLGRREYRPWAQVVFPARYGDDWSFSHRIRYDMRFRKSVAEGRVVDGVDFTNRFRFQTVLTRTLARIGPGRVLAQVADEVLVNAGPDAGPNFLDQNRVSLLFGYAMTEATFRVGYMHRFLPGASGASPRHEHAMLLWVNHRTRLSRGDYEPLLPEQGNP